MAHVLPLKYLLTKVRKVDTVYNLRRRFERRDLYSVPRKCKIYQEIIYYLKILCSRYTTKDPLVVDSVTWCELYGVGLFKRI